jgi:hypothetical protein
MKRIILIASLLLPPSASADPLDIIRGIRAAYPNLPNNPEVTYRALVEIREQIPSLGLLKKPSGNRCPDNQTLSPIDYSCDFLCDRDGNGYDIFQDWDAAATPRFSKRISKDPLGTLARCEFLDAAPTPEPTPLPEPVPPPTDPALIARLTAIEAALGAISTRLDQMASPLAVAAHEASNAAQRAARVETLLLSQPPPPAYRGRVLGFPVTLRPEQVQVEPIE